MSRTQHEDLFTALLAVLALAGPAGAAGQATESTFGYFANGARPLVIPLDSLGVYAPGVESADSISVLTASWAGRPPRALGNGLFVVGLPQARTREGLAGLARMAVTQGSGVITAAGLVVRPPSGPRRGERLIVTDQFIVEFAPGVTRPQVDSMAAAHGARVITPLGLLKNDYLLAVGAGGLDALGIANLFHESPLTRFAHPNYLDAKIELAPTPDDPLVADQWHLHNTGTTHGAPDADIDAPEAWTLTQGDPGTVIAVLEIFGFDTLNTDLHDNLWINPGETPGNAADDADPWVKVDDVHGWDFHGCAGPVALAHTDPCGQASLFASRQQHGTAVAGLAAANGSNGVGVSGVCPRCSLMLVSVATGEVGTATAIRYAWEMGASVISLSWGSSISPTSYTAAQITAATVYGRGGKGAIVVAAASEDNDDQCSDNFYGLPEVIAVTGSDDFDHRASRAGFGACIDIMAPGWMANTAPMVPPVSSTAACAPPNGNGTACYHVSGIVTTDSTGTGGYNDQSPEPIGCKLTESADRAYTRCFSGTSAAAPIVAGVAGLVLSLNPTLTEAQVKDILYTTADRIDYDATLCPGSTANPAGYAPACPIDGTSWSPTHGHGRVNAFAALQAVPTVIAKPKVLACELCDGPGAFEVGTRMGLTVQSGSVDQTTWAVPGNGPLAIPALYAAWFPTSHTLLEFQFGGYHHAGSSVTEEHAYVWALNPGVLVTLGTGALVTSASAAIRVSQIGSSPSTTNTGLGVALAYRYKPFPFLALRWEGLFRHWTSPSIDEVGATFAFGVVIP